MNGQIDRTFIEKTISHNSIYPKEIHPLQRYADRPSLFELFTSTMHNNALRNKTIYAACTTYGYTFKEIADHLHVHYAMVIRAIKGMEREKHDFKT